MCSSSASSCDMFQNMGTGFERMQPGWEDSHSFYPEENDMGNWDGSQDSNSSWGGSSSSWNRPPRGLGRMMPKVQHSESLPSMVLGILTKMSPSHLCLMNITLLLLDGE